MNKKKTGNIGQKLYLIAAMPMFIMAVIILLYGNYRARQMMYAQAGEDLKAALVAFEMEFDALNPGDYALVGQEALSLYKGDEDITRAYGLFDEFADRTELEVSLYYYDTCILTSLRDSSGSRVVGNGAANQIMDAVYKAGESKYYDNTRILGKDYLSYYMPLRNSDDSIVGMLSISRDRAAIDKRANGIVIPMFVMAAVLLVVGVLTVRGIWHKIMESISELHVFLDKSSDGDVTASLSEKVISRNDEIGEIGRNVLNMQRTLRDMLEKDPLTQLFNRRSAARKLDNIALKSEANGMPFSMAIGDIDFFKKVNDTYGHDAGDDLLKALADLFREFMKPYGFAARWGGEEFLFVFEKKDENEAAELLNKMLDQVRVLEVISGDNIIKITMSFGVSSDTGLDREELLKSADDKLYYAKQNGRNRVVTSIND